MKLSQLLKYGYNILKESEIESYHTDAQIIISCVINRDRLYVLTNPDTDISIEQERIIIKNFNKRAKGCPLQYIINTCEFYSMDFYVNENVLIPRPDTEVLVNEAIKLVSGNNSKIIEIGTGSGAIAVSIAKHCQNSIITATDVSDEAILIAKKNAELHNVIINFRLGDIFLALKHDDYPADYIISNPPYIETEVINELDTSVKDYEPRLALDGGADGLYFYKKIIEGCSRYLLPGGTVLFEIGYNQGDAVKKILTQYSFTDITILKDLAGLDRVITAILANKKECQPQR